MEKFENNTDLENKPLDENVIKSLREPLFDSSLPYYFSAAMKEGRRLRPEFEGKTFREIRENDEFLKAYDKYASELHNLETLSIEEREIRLSKFAAEFLYEENK